MTKNNNNNSGIDKSGTDNLPLRMILDLKIRKEKAKYFLSQKQSNITFQCFERVVRKTTQEFFERKELMRFYSLNKQKYFDVNLFVDEFLNSKFNFSDHTIDFNDDGMT